MRRTNSHTSGIGISIFNHFGLHFLGFICLTSTASTLNAQKKPNVLLIISDDLNTRIGPYMEIDDHTPQLDRLAKEGVKFSRAYSQYPLCGPSRASLMSGLYPETNGIINNSTVLGSYRKVNKALAGHPSMAGFLRERGYYTARVSKIYHMGVPGGIETGEPGGDDPDSWDYAYNVLAPETLSQGELELLSPKNHHYGSNFARMILADALEGTQADYLAASQAIAILENRAGKAPEKGTNQQKLKEDSPFFLAVGFVRPHVPFIAPENCYVPYKENDIILPPVIVGQNVPVEALQRSNERVWGMNELQKRRTISSYMASVRFMDQQVGRLLDALDRLQLREETIVIFLSDHGYNLGEHNCWSKVSLWEGSVRSPLIISVPGKDYQKNHGKTCESITELIDLYPTVTELCGHSGEIPGILQGKSLTGCISGDELTIPDAYAYTISKPENASIRTEKYRYTRWGAEINNGNEELYDHSVDPEENVNLAGNPEYREVISKMREKLASIRNKSALGIMKNN